MKNDYDNASDYCFADLGGIFRVIAGGFRPFHVGLRHFFKR
jgi:hypothetical protein